MEKDPGESQGLFFVGKGVLCHLLSYRKIRITKNIKFKSLFSYFAFDLLFFKSLLRIKIVRHVIKKDIKY